MTAAAGTEALPEDAPDDEKPDGAGTETPPEEKDWEAEFKAQQKINRDLERRHKTRMKELEQQVATATAKPAEGDDKPDLEAIRKQVRDEVNAESLREKALDKLETKAARLFENPEDARTFLAGNVDDFIDDGKVDTNAITEALTDLLKARPYLGVTQGDAKRFQGSADAGAKGTAGKPQLTEADVKRLAKEGKHADIEAARVNGQLNTLLGIT